MTANSVSFKGDGCKSGSCALKAVELTLGGLPHVPQSGLRVEQSSLTVGQKSAVGVVAAQAVKADGRKWQVGGATR
jgi:hypothetical protein